jgi:hypothetical protein
MPRSKMDFQTRWPHLYAMLAAAEHDPDKGAAILNDARNHRLGAFHRIKALRANREERDLMLKSWPDA